MAESTVETPALYKEEKTTQGSDHDDSLEEKRAGGGDSEKYGVQYDTQIVTEVGDVYEDVRAIDLDENGKEKPIGVYCSSHFQCRW